MTTPSPHIGTLNEKPLHAALKAWYAEEGDLFEVPVDGFVADILRSGLVIEIQTGSASSLRRKLAQLIRTRPVRLVLPVAVEKTLVRIDELGRLSQSRRSPKRATPVDVFRELVSLHEILGDSNFSVDVALVREEEVRQTTMTRRRRDWTVRERRLIEVVDCLSFHHPADYLAVVPAELAEPFTTADLAAAITQPRWMAQKIAYVLRKMGILAIVGKQGNALLYVRNAHGALNLEGGDTDRFEYPSPHDDD
jgi:hypothetical protein